MRDEQLKMMSLLVFTFQNAAFVLLMRWSKVLDTHYNSTVAVFLTEVLKLPLSVLLLMYEKRSVSEACATLNREILGAPLDTLKISVPALLYTVQNNCLFVAMGYLEAAVFQCTYQLKTLTTAVLTVTMLGRSIAAHQWGALVLLMAGTVLVQEPPAKGGGGADSSAGMMVGIGATVAACVCSSVASVYLEKILIESKPSIWVRNAQLCLFTIPIAAVGTQMVKDDYLKEEGTPIHGFTFAVWASIVTNAAGGMIVAVVMKFAGNILRNFAQACAIVVGGIGSCLLFDFVITSRFVGGVGLVILSIFIYGSKVEQLIAWLAAVGLARSSDEAAYAPVPLAEEAPPPPRESADEEAAPPPSAAPPADLRPPGAESAGSAATAGGGGKGR